MSEPKRFTITIESTVTLLADEIWPDGDAPENPTEQDVRDLVAAHGGPVRVLRDWSLADEDLYFGVREESR